MSFPELSNIEFIFSNSVSAAVGLAPSQVPLGRPPRVHLTLLGCQMFEDVKDLERDPLEYLNQAKNDQNGA